MGNQRQRIAEIEAAVERGEYFSLTMDDLKLVMDEQALLSRDETETAESDIGDYRVREHCRQIARRLGNLSRACYFLMEIERYRAHQMESDRNLSGRGAPSHGNRSGH